MLRSKIGPYLSVTPTPRSSIARAVENFADVASLTAKTAPSMNSRTVMACLRASAAPTQAIADLHEPVWSQLDKK